MNAEGIKQVKKRMFELQARISLLETEHANESVYFGSRRTADVRRSSMELTRALAQLRKPN